MVRSPAVAERRSRLGLFAAAALSLALAGCAARAFKKASDADTVESYRAFIRQYPDTENADAALTRLADLEYERVAQLHTVVACKRYLEEFPDSAKAPDARALLEAQRFNAAKERGTLEAYRQFLRDHPEGAHHQEAEQWVESALLAQALASKDAAAGEAALKHLDNPQAREAAQGKLDDQAFANASASGAPGMLAYLREHAAGGHREDAQVVLFALKLDGLLFSDQVEAARAESARSPLSAKVPGLAEKLARAEADRAVTRSGAAEVQAALSTNYLRSIEDLKKSLQAPDSLDRWEAAEELGQWVSVAAIDPLLTAIHSARNALVRVRAFDSLGQVLRGLPRPVAEYEVATRLEALRERTGSADVYLEVAVLRDLSGHPEAALPDYQRAFDAAMPDPVILWRLMQLRRERRQFFSSAVAGRQMALWSRSVAEAVDPASPAVQARELCAASEAVRAALEAITAARAEKTEFPEDLPAFEATARDAQRLVTARLQDAELALKTQNPNVRACSDGRWTERVNEALRARLDALRALRKRSPAIAERVLTLARERDPAPEVRAAAAQLLGEKRAGR
jgi:hypothetical protein